MRVEVIIGKMIITSDHLFIGSHPANWATGTQTRARFGEVAAAGIDVEEVNAKLLADGLEAFVVAYGDLLDAVKAAR